VNAGIVKWHVESAKVSLEAAASLDDRTAAHALRVLANPWSAAGRSPADDQSLLEAVQRDRGLFFYMLPR
jgi:hypothetical protein